MVALTRNIARKQAMEMLLTGDYVDAERARELGLVNRVAAPEALEQETAEFARSIASKPRATVRLGKEAFYHQLELGLSSAYDYVSEVMTQNMLGEEAAEGIGAFLEKRSPNWPG
jgi:enoyl-CoA hydratase/carnithine racemase